MMLSLKRDAGAGTVPLSLTQYNDRATTTQTWTQSPTAAATFFDPVVDSYYADLKDPSRQISIGIVSNALGQAFRLHGMDIFYKPGPVENRA